MEADCSNASSCNINCIGEHACEQMPVICPLNAECNIGCLDDGSGGASNHGCHNLGSFSTNDAYITLTCTSTTYPGSKCLFYYTVCVCVCVRVVRCVQCKMFLILSLLPAFFFFLPSFILVLFIYFLEKKKRCNLIGHI